MLVYNITINVQEQWQQEWLSWMRQVQMPTLESIEAIDSFRVMRLVSQVMGVEGVTYAVQLNFAAANDLDAYLKNYDAALEARQQKLFGGKYVRFCTQLEEI